MTAITKSQQPALAYQVAAKTRENMTPKDRVFGTLRLVIEHVQGASSELDLDRAYILRALERAASWEPLLADAPDEVGQSNQ